MKAFKKPPCIIESYCLSYTAKYWGFLGSHSHEGLKCWLVGAVNTETGETVARHYNEKESVNELLAKKEAFEAWEELRGGLERKPTAEERDLDSQLLAIWNESARRSRLLSSKRGPN
jgi:hypothetical protein